MAKKKPIDWTLAPAPESKEHVKINEPYELYWQEENIDGAQAL